MPDVGAEPTLNDYYEPSALQKEYELMFIAGGLALLNVSHANQSFFSVFKLSL